MSQVIEIVKKGFDGQVDFYERRAGLWQLIFPVFHEDGDMIDIFVSSSPTKNGWVRIKDMGLTLMRLSYVFEVNTPTKERILETLLVQNGVMEDEGEFYLDSPPDMVLPKCDAICRLSAKGLQYEAMAKGYYQVFVL
ncbi:MAG: DUF1828 domain-containing protein [Ghiorsea sp.]|nr:DUF1828 domain-containing protein [Ghiorsea sp.]